MAPHTTVGFRVYLNTPRPPAHLVAAFQGASTGHVCDAMDRLSAMDFRIKPLVPTSQLCGPALTVRTRPGDNLMVWKALEVARPVRSLGGGPIWQARRDSNPQPPVLETGAPPIELLSCISPNRSNQQSAVSFL